MRNNKLRETVRTVHCEKRHGRLLLGGFSQCNFSNFNEILFDLYPTGKAQVLKMLRKCRNTFIDPTKYMFLAGLILTPEKELAEALGYHFGCIFVVFPTDLSQLCVAAPGSAASFASAETQRQTISTTFSHLPWQQVRCIIV